MYGRGNVLYKLVSNYILTEFLDSKKHLQAQEYEFASYRLECILIAVEKLFFLILISINLNILTQSLVTFFSCSFIRTYSHGWHAKSTIMCSATSIVFFSVFPYILKIIPITPNLICSMIVIIFVIMVNYYYAPADVEENPLICKSMRLKMKKKVLFRIIFLSVLIFIPFANNFKKYMLLGILIQTMLIMPITYKLTKRGYKNYENYENYE